MTTATATAQTTARAPRPNTKAAERIRRREAREISKMHRAVAETVEAMERGVAAPGTEVIDGGIKYVVDRMQRMVRVPCKKTSVKRAEVRHALMHERTIEEDDVLRLLGRNVLNYMVSVDQLRRDERNPRLLWVTRKCGTDYDLPLPTVATGATVQFVK